MEGNPAARFIPAAVFFLAAAGVFARGFARRKRGKKTGWKTAAVFCVLLLAGVLAAAGVIDCAGLLARWFVYQGL
jgi:hypothetical protein